MECRADISKWNLLAKIFVVVLDFKVWLHHGLFFFTYILGSSKGVEPYSCIIIILLRFFIYVRLLIEKIYCEISTFFYKIEVYI